MFEVLEIRSLEKGLMTVATRSDSMVRMIRLLLGTIVARHPVVQPNTLRSLDVFSKQTTV